ncbi:H+/Cl- antiporter ClcA [Trichococcus patagoniensis]|uniref:H+/Cl-antiporter ClcA n=1 Tax=Trichococcus patagoniensis TaxID=382641 RepID=A0A2T5IGG7_9LACT|nr:chloride channel protein [Trichococcus patagoniensis]PTQ82927.1 H+/Cl- antiporter ClcA [Trichococcus patagoniensis]
MELKKSVVYQEIIFYGMAAIAMGIIVGALDALFGEVLILITQFRGQHIAWLLPFLAVAGLAIVHVYQKFGKNSSKGMGLVFTAGNKQDEEIPKRLVPLVIGGTWLTHLFGGSAGREGVAVQIGATVGYTFGKKIHFQDSKKILLVAGMAAGFAGLFQTPMAATFFALEVLMVGAIEYRALFPAALSAFAAAYTSHFLGLEKFSVDLNVDLPVDLSFAGKVVLLGIVFGAIGGLFAKLLKNTKGWLAQKITDPYRRIFVVGVLLTISLFALHMGRYSGLGTNLISASFEAGTIYSYDWVLKLVLTIVTLAAGFQGGEVTPLFSIGASLGYWLAPLFGLPPEFVAALGYASVFASATNTFIAPIFIGVEVFGYDTLPYFFAIVSVAYAFNNGHSIYAQEKAKIDHLR